MYINMSVCLCRCHHYRGIILLRPVGHISDNDIFSPIINCYTPFLFDWKEKTKLLPSRDPPHPHTHKAGQTTLFRASFLASCSSPCFVFLSHPLRFGCFPASSGAISHWTDWRMTQKNQFWNHYLREQHKLFCFSLHYNQSQSNKKVEQTTQFIPGAVPPKLKVDGTTGVANLYPPCFSIILDSAR